MANKILQTEFKCPKCNNVMIADVNLREMINYELQRILDTSQEILMMAEDGEE